MLYSIVVDPSTSASNLNHDLELISQWAFQWKMDFNPDPNKQCEDNVGNEIIHKADEALDDSFSYLRSKLYMRDPSLLTGYVKLATIENPSLWEAHFTTSTRSTIFFLGH